MSEVIPFLVEAGKAVAEIAARAAIDYAIQSALGTYDRKTDPESAKFPIKQAVPPVQIYYGRGRVSGPFLYWATVGHFTIDVIALAKGPVKSIDRFYLNDDKVTLVGGVVKQGEDGRYKRGSHQTIRIATRTGETPSPVYTELLSITDGQWTAAHRADGVATMAVICEAVKAEIVQTIYPNGPVQASAVGDWALVYDWRKDATQPGGSGPQRRDQPSTWAWSENPVVCLVHDEWHERGHDFDYRFKPTLAQLTVAANICDELVPQKAGGMAKRYAMFGGYKSVAPPKDLRLRFLATFNGLMIERGDGAFVIIAGAYAEPTVVLNEDRIKSFRWRKIRRTEDICNQIVLSFNSPAHDYSMVETAPWRDEVSIAAMGEYSQPLGLEWVTNHSQARRLAKAHFYRLNAEYDGQLVIDLSDDERELEQRFFRVRNNLGPLSMRDVVVEVTGMAIDLVNRLVTLDVVRADPEAYAWDAALEEGDPPAVPAGNPVAEILEPVIIASEVVFTSDLPRLRITFEDIGRTDYGIALRWKIEDSTDDAYVMEFPEVYDRLGGVLVVESGIIPPGTDIDFGIAFVTGAGQIGTFAEGSAGTIVPPSVVTPPSISGLAVTGSTLTADPAVWAGSPGAITRQWTRNGAAIPGASGLTYILVSADAGASIRFTETASNAGGSSTSQSNAIGPVVAPKTYAEFEAHITGLAPTLFGWADGIGAAGSGRAIVGAPAGAMGGSSWESAARSASTAVSRFIQHALPSLASMTAITGTQVMFTKATASTTARPGLDRNGYASPASASGAHVSCTLCLWYDPVLGPMQNNPSAGTGPTPYSW